MTQKSIEIIVGIDGSLKIEAVGFAGADCEKATAFLEQVLGTATARKQKPEYYQAATIKKVQKVGS